MNAKDARLLNDIQVWLWNHTVDKFRRGVEEHGGKLNRKPVLRFMRDEIIDLPTYFFVLESQHEAAADLLDRALYRISDDKGAELVAAAFNILTYGNPEGIVEEER